MLENVHLEVRDESGFLRLLRDLLSQGVGRLECDALSIRIPQLKGEMRVEAGMPFHLAPELFVQLSGTTVFELPEEVLTVGPGEVCLIPRGMPHRERIFSSPERPFHNLVVLHGHDELFFHLAHERPDHRPKGYLRSRLVGDGCEGLLGLLNGAAELSRGPSPAQRTGIKGFLMAYFSLFLTMLEEAGNGEEREPFPVTRARQIVLASIHDPGLTVASVAREVQLHPDYLSLLFRQATRQSLQAYITRNRFLRACELLRSSALNMAQVSEAAGFRDPSYFTRFFRQRQGMTPLAYRRAAGRKVERWPPAG
ncbi:MAG TPA: AraC family transcriptional regulator [Chthoniobacteraceae bacterium]|nr:AraC family transcriptional regulator [Chthoniobacteraceae bacterium]